LARRFWSKPFKYKFIWLRYVSEFS